ncbi:MAG TPA: ABC transporter permease [Gammaproteobacteria bacterium]|nr:ABC transporter permease [Gammaproteobacteria bacterium]
MHRRANWIGFLSLSRHEIVRCLRIWPQTLLPPLATTVLYYVIFGNVMGARIGNMHGFTYLEFIMPGLVMMNIIDSSYSNVMSSFFMAKFFRSIEELLITPMPNYIILLGFMVGGMFRGLIVGALVALMSLIFIKVTVYNFGLMILMALLTSSFLSLIGFINGVFARKFDDLSIVPMFVLIPLSFFGGVFYSVQLLPPFWQTAIYANPIFYMISGFRYAMLGIADVSLQAVLLMLGGGVAVMYCLCLWMLRRGVGIKT